MPSVPESFQKKSARLAEHAKAQKAKAASDAAADKEFIKAITARANAYEAEYAKLEQDAIDNRRKAKASGDIFVPPEEKLAFVVRIRGTIGVAPKVKKILQLFRLRQLHNGVFVKLNAATINMLRMIEPYIAYGSPNLKSVKELIYKRGYGKVNGQRIPLSSNKVIQNVLGDKGIECVEDLIHEIYTVGPNFKEAANFLWPVKMPSPKGGFGAGNRKLQHHNEDGAAGAQGYKINKLIKKLL